MTETQENNLVNLISNILIEKIQNIPGCIEYFRWILEQDDEQCTLIDTYNHFQSKNHYKLTKENDRLSLYIRNETDEQNFSEYIFRLKVLTTTTGSALDVKSSFNIKYITETPQTDLQISITELPLIVRGFDYIIKELGLTNF